MSYLRSLSGILALALSFLRTYGQLPVGQSPFSNLRNKVFHVKEDTLRIDTVSIVPNSFSIQGVPAAAYKFDPVRALIVWKNKPDLDSIRVLYRVFPYNLSASIQRMSYDSVMNNFYVAPFEFNNGYNAPKSVFDFGTLKAEGSFGRQIGFGNSQDAVLNSNLNLQLSGLLGDSIEVQAAITDNNIPIQPDGTTQQLNEFDQVYLQFKKRGWQLNLGDIDLRRNEDYFLNFYKRLQGASFQTENRLSRSINSKSMISGSIAKGKFTRNVFQGLEGNQGPYRLVGANNEFFFIVLANTERVFIDGEPLQRGEDQDYVINYNSAEITFTPKRMITKDSRIQVEFEYADRNFLNANLYASQEIEINQKLKIRASVFNNSDAKNSQINQVLDTKQKQFLANLGDSIQKAFYPSAVVDSFSASKILYEKIYYNPGTGPDSFYHYSTNPSTAFYNLSFIDVGDGNGNYIPDFNGANGKVYKFLLPVSGIKQGRFEPVQVLVTPKKQQVVDLNLEYRVNRNLLIKTELATSNNDVNTFSSKNKGDDRGWAGKFGITNSSPLRAKGRWQLNTGLDYEYVQDKFRPLERLRPVEFSRDWGLPLVTGSVTENIIHATAGLKNNLHSFSYDYEYYNRSDQYNGSQHSIIQHSNFNGWILNNQLVLTNYSTQFDKGSFFRPIADISKAFKKIKNWRLGFRYSREQNARHDKNTDTLTALSFLYDSYSIYLKSDENKRNHYGISFFTRSDKYPMGKDFTKGDRSYNLNLTTELLKNPKRQFYLNTTFRKLKVYNPAFSKQKDDETILGRAEYVMEEWKGLLTGDVLYEVGAGQEQRRDYAYLEVPPGTGQYAWIDYNNDGVQQLNEFELAAFPDQAKFIRIFTPTNDFIKANYITFHYSFNINPRALLGALNLKGMKKFISKFNILTALQINKKSLALGNFEFNPFKYGVDDTALLTLGTSIQNTISYNRYSQKWGIDFSNLRNNGKSLLTYGYESRRLNDWLVKYRMNIGRTFLFTLNGKKGLNILSTPQFGNRNFELDTYSAEPMLEYILPPKFRLVAGYKLEHKKNKPVYGGEKSLSNSINIESKYNILQSSSITAKFTFNNISYDFPANTTVSYIMLDGLLPGKNFLWSLGFSKRLLNNLELSFQYDGRKAGHSQTVHVGRAMITALF